MYPVACIGNGCCRWSFLFVLEQLRRFIFLRLSKTGSCCANPRINTGQRLYPRNLVPTRYCLPRHSEAFCRCFRPRPACLPESMKRCTCTTLNQISPRNTPPSIRHSVYTLLINLPFHRPGTDVAPWLLRGETRPHLHTRRSSRLHSSSIGPCGGSVVPEGGEGGGVGQCSCEVGDDEDRRTTRSPDVGENKPYLSTPNDISHGFYPGVYPIGMARGDMARTYCLTTSSFSRWSVLDPRASELLAIFITVPSYTGYVERSVNRTDVESRSPPGAGRRWARWSN